MSDRKKMVLRSFYITPDDDMSLTARAEMNGITRSEQIRRFVHEGLQKGMYVPDPKPYDPEACSACGSTSCYRFLCYGID